MSRRIAAIDFGTNTARLLIGDCRASGGFDHICLKREIVRMGGGFSAETGLSPEAVERGLSCLGRFAGIMREHQVSTVRAVATSAVRDAANGREFIEQALQETGVKLLIIDGILEAKLTLSGVMAGLDQQHDDLLLFDIGGGSTEYTVAVNGQAAFVCSLPLGVVRLVEGKATQAAMEQKIRKELSGLLRRMQDKGVVVNPGATLIGTAGTATTLAAIQMGMVEYDYRKVNNSVISKQEIQAIYNKLAPLAPAERLAVPGLEKGREDLIIVGILITLQTMDLFGIEKMKVSDYGMLEGLIAGEELIDG